MLVSKGDHVRFFIAGSPLFKSVIENGNLPVPTVNHHFPGFRTDPDPVANGVTGHDLL